MALIYRAIWKDTATDATSLGHEAFAAWVRHKYGLDVPRQGVTESAAIPGVDAVTTTADRHGYQAFRGVLHEDRDTERWTTTLTVIQRSGGQSSYWVDLEMVARDAFRLPRVRPPRLISLLLERCADPRSGPVPVRGTPREWRANDARGLADAIIDPSRDLPMVVFTPDPVGGLDLAGRRATSAAANLIGVASVELVYPLAVPDVNSILGRDLEVWGGGARVYLPGVVLGEPGYRHFVIPRSALAPDIDRGWWIAFDRLATSIAARRAPEGYDEIRADLLSRPGGAAAEKLETDFLEALAENERLRRDADLALEAALDLRINAVADLEDAQRELAEKTERLAYLDRVLATSQVDAASWEAATLGTAAIPELAASPSDAVRLANEHLPRLAIPASATEHIDELDAALESRGWGQSIWRALRALETYAQASAGAAGFWDWCQTSGHAYAWPATSKKLAMSESDTAMQTYGDDRRFRVDPALSADGYQTMVAHIKVAEGGGPLAPRIYFLDDTRGATGRIHVGYVGPHKYMRNAGTN